MIAVGKELIEAIMPRVSGSKGTKQGKIVAALDGVLAKTLQKYAIDTPLRIAHFLAQLAHESDGFSTCEEYASGAAYEGRRDLGNTEAGDGRRFKGRGLIQLTGRANYRKYGQAIGIDLVGNPERAAEPELSLKLACEYWTRTRGGLNRFADRDDLYSITRAINGGTNGLEDRRRYLGRAKLAVARVAAGELSDRGEAGAPQVLRRGCKGVDVERLQRLLQKAGLPVAIDGDFGPGTDMAVKTFQKRRKLVVDGIVGPSTWTALGV